jgi:hypothetical protein
LPLQIYPAVDATQEEGGSDKEEEDDDEQPGTKRSKTGGYKQANVVTE